MGNFSKNLAFTTHYLSSRGYRKESDIVSTRNNNGDHKTLTSRTNNFIKAIYNHLNTEIRNIDIVVN